MSDNIHDLVLLRDLSIATMIRIDNNFRKIVVINTALIALGILGVLAPSTSSLLHNTSTMLLCGYNMRPILK